MKKPVEWIDGKPVGESVGEKVRREERKGERDLRIKRPRKKEDQRRPSGR